METKILIYSNKNLEKLPNLPTNLEELHCDSNKLSQLPDLPKNLKVLSCFNNNLSKLIF